MEKAMNTQVHSLQRALILNPIFDTAMSSPQNALDRRILKFSEEYGEINEAYLDLTSSNHKGKSSNDVLEEIVDAYIVSVDLVVQNAMANQLPLEDIRDELNALLDFHLSGDFLRSDIMFSFGHCASALGNVWGDYLTNNKKRLPDSLLQLHSAICAMLFRAEIPGLPLGDDRNVMVPKIVETKLNKWRRNRLLPNAA
ncbi:hypothetical protein LC612_33025 [Nostoc sp. CHAB 5834]|nr:hypothetical protein [Nostoc sp. CHAB 5834]